jgi:D-galactarolactone isomerase
MGTEAPKLKAPVNATDCHHHIYNAKYPVDPKATLRPGDALVPDYRALQKRIGTTRNVLVQPSTYGTDNRCHLEALAAFGATARIAPAAKIMEIMPILERVPSQIVFDHLAHIPQPDGVNNPLYAKVRTLMDKGRTWVKLSGAYADTKVGPPTYSDSSAVARAYAKAMPERCVWGSDWPHPSEQSKHLPDDAVLFDLHIDWVPDEKTRHRVLVENPATLYDFPKG